MIIVKWNYSVPILNAPAAIRSSVLDRTDVIGWRQMVRFHFQHERRHFNGYIQFLSGLESICSQVECIQGF